MLTLAHKNLEVWKKSIAMVSEAYRLTATFPDSERFGLIAQIRRAAVSVPSNLAEGASRKTSPDQQRFYVIARSSVVEIDTQLEIAAELGYLDKEKTVEMDQLMNQVLPCLLA